MTYYTAYFGLCKPFFNIYFLILNISIVLNILNILTIRPHEITEYSDNSFGQKNKAVALFFICDKIVCGGVNFYPHSIYVLSVHDECLFIICDYETINFSSSIFL